MRLSTVLRRLERLGVDRARVDVETRVVAQRLDKLLRPLGLEIRRVGHRALPRRAPTAPADRGPGRARPRDARLVRAEQAAGADDDDSAALARSE